MSQTKAELIEPQGNVAFDTNTLYVDAGNNRVGIGTTSPGKPLDVRGTGSANIGSFSNGTQGIDIATTASGGSIQTYDQNQTLDLKTFGTTTNSINFTVGSTERARIDSSGRLLVGTSTARDNFFNTTGIAPQIQLEGNAVGSRVLSIISSDSTVTRGGALLLGHQKSGTIGGNTALGGTDSIGFITFQGSDGSEFVEGAKIEAIIDGGVAANDLPTALVFSTTADGASSPTERMRIDNSGVVSCIAGLRSLGVYNYTTSGGAANVHIDANYDFRRSTSCLRFKADVETLGDAYADAILNCRPVWYRSLCGGDNPEWGFYGFIAEEVEQVDKRLCTYGPSDDGSEELVLTGVQYDRFVPHLLNLIKRQQQAIETLEAKVAALESV